MKSLVLEVTVPFSLSREIPALSLAVKILPSLLQYREEGGALRWEREQCRAMVLPWTTVDVLQSYTAWKGIGGIQLYLTLYKAIVLREVNPPCLGHVLSPWSLYPHLQLPPVPGHG